MNALPQHEGDHAAVSGSVHCWCPCPETLRATRTIDGYEHVQHGPNPEHVFRLSTIEMLRDPDGSMLRFHAWLDVVHKRERAPMPEHVPA